MRYPNGVSITVEIYTPMDGLDAEAIFDSVADFVHDRYDDVCVALGPYKPEGDV